MVFHLLGGVVNALQTFADEWVFGVVLIDFGVDEVEVVVKLARFAEKHIFHARFEAVLDPFQSPEPHHFDAARLVAEQPRGARSPRYPDELDVGDSADQLIIHGIVVDVSHLLDLAAVDVTERKLVEHILIGGHAQLLLQDFGFLRPDALQIGNVRLQQVQFHATKVRIFHFICKNHYFCCAKYNPIKMKKLLLIVLSVFLFTSLFAQTKMQFRDPFWVDTTSTDFQSIVKLWNDYKSSLVSEQSPTAFWMESEVDTYGNPDLLIQSFTLSKYDFMDFMGGKELFIGVEKRNDTLFEMRTMLFSNFPTDNQLTGVFTYPVVKVAENEYRFYSKLSLLKPDMKSYQVGWVTYFYPYNYPFDKEAADQTYAVANEFAAAMGLEKPKPVEYYLFNDRTEYFRYLGADRKLGA